LALNSYTKNYDLGELAQKHKQAANDLWLIREKYLSLRVDVAMREKPLEALQDHRDQLVQELHKVYSGAPSTTFKAYKKAQEALQKFEDMTFTDAEIDAFLPNELKRVSPAQAVLNR
jgi:vacuolar-type H+-ATPase subunit D/Vma8